MSVELVANIGGVLDLSRYGKSKRGEDTHFPQQSHQSITITHIQFAIILIQVHQFALSLQATTGSGNDNTVILVVIKEENHNFTALLLKKIDK